MFPAQWSSLTRTCYKHDLTISIKPTSLKSTQFVLENEIIKKLIANLFLLESYPFDVHLLVLSPIPSAHFRSFDWFFFLKDIWMLIIRTVVLFIFGPWMVVDGCQTKCLCKYLFDILNFNAGIWILSDNLKWHSFVVIVSFEVVVVVVDLSF